MYSEHHFSEEGLFGSRFSKSSFKFTGKWKVREPSLASVSKCHPNKNYANLWFILLCIGQIEAQHDPPPPGKPREFDTFAVPGRREFDYQSLPGGGEFDLHALGVGNLNCTHDFMRNLLRGGVSWGTRCWGIFVEKIAFVANWLRGKGLNKLGFEYMNV